MSEPELRALRAISHILDWTATAEHAWNPRPYHVGGMHPRAERLILDGIEEASRLATASPLGAVIEGPGGAGKTHLLGWVRGEVARAGGYFFLVEFGVGDDFWRRTTGAMVTDLGKPANGADVPVQAMVALHGLADLAGVGDRIRAAAERPSGLSLDDLDALVNGLRAKDRQLLHYKDTIRALALYATDKGPGVDVAHDHLKSAEEAEEGDRRAWGMSRQVKPPHDIAVELSAILALTGPSVIAVDQIDAILRLPRSQQAGTEPGGETVDEVAGGLMALRHATRRTLCLVACLPDSWERISNHAVDTARDRFRTSLILNSIPTAEVARELVERRFEVAFADAGYNPPHPVWPIEPGAFATATNLTPRALLQRIGEHIDGCRADGVVRPLERFTTDAPVIIPPPGHLEAQPDFGRLDARFKELRAQAEVEDAFDAQHEDEVAPVLLTAGLTAWITEQGEAGRGFSVDPLPGHKPPVHARLRQVLDPDTDEQRHWTFRVIGAKHHIAALKRLKDGMAESGIGPKTPDRCFIVLRNHAWTDGPSTRKQLDLLEDSGGRSIPLRSDDLRVFEALRLMEADHDPEFDLWLRARRPASGTELLGDILSDVAGEPPAKVPQRPEPSSAPIIPVGRRLDTGATLELKLSVLARHTAVFAGSGSGKTVFLRRLVEECALHGVSSIVLDPNNDLARLGDPWPAPRLRGPNRG
ncbi:hypothetical protein C1I98_26125, partial [Spongiactinospora gelatinilytica]